MLEQREDYDEVWLELDAGAFALLLGSLPISAGQKVRIKQWWEWRRRERLPTDAFPVIIGRAVAVGG